MGTAHPTFVFGVLWGFVPAISLRVSVCFYCSGFADTCIVKGLL